MKELELDGFALLPGAKALRPTVPVIVFSGHVDAAVALQLVNMGAYDVLPKPFNREEFLTVLGLALHTYDLAREVRVRRLMTERLSQRAERLKRLIVDSHRRPNTIKGFQGIISTSRELNGKSLATLESSLDRLWAHAKRAQASLDVAQQRLLAMQQQSRKDLLNPWLVTTPDWSPGHCSPDCLRQHLFTGTHRLSTHSAVPTPPPFGTRLCPPIPF